MAVQLEHANITVQNVDEAIRFVTTAFPDFKIRGEGQVDHGSGPRRWVHVGTEATYLALEEASLPPQSARAGASEPGFNHLGYVVDDVVALAERLRAAGYREGFKPQPHPHRTRVYFLDADDNEWEFVEYHSDDPAKRNDYSL